MSQIKTNIDRTIILNDTEQRCVRYIARIKQRENMVPLVKTQQTQRKDYLVQSFGAEFAFCVLHNVYPPTEVIEYNQWDVIVPNVGKVDIKATERIGGRLIINKKKINHDANAFALMVGSFPKYVFGGWIKVSEAIDESHLKDLGHGECYAIDQEHLNRNLMIGVTR